MEEKFAKLINVKSLVTLVLTLVFAFLAVIGAVTAEQFLTVFTVIIAFYFGTQTQKAADRDGGAESPRPIGPPPFDKGGTSSRETEKSKGE